MKLRIIALPLLSLALRVFANWGGYAEGNLGTGTLKGIGLDQVEMVSESLSIVLYKQYAAVIVKYEFSNTAGPVEVKAGFPCMPCERCSEGEDTLSKPKLDVFDYNISADGNNLAYELVEGKEEKWFQISGTTLQVIGMGNPNFNPDQALTPIKTYWMLSKLGFEKGQAHRVTISYKANYQSAGGGFSEITDYDSQVLRYFLHTGASWKGPIKHGYVRIHAADQNADLILLGPKDCFTRQDKDFIWIFSNLKPNLKDNIIIDLNNSYTRPYDFTAGVDQKIECWYVFEDTNYYYDFHDYTVSATSTLSNKSEYQASNVADFDEKTAWVEGVKGDGIGESLTLNLNKPADLFAIGILPGYYRSKEAYYSNNRVAKLKVTINGKQSKEYELCDDFNTIGAKEHRAYQFLTLPHFDELVKTLTLTIMGVYKGTEYDDACISEVLLRVKLAKEPEIRGAR